MTRPCGCPGAARTPHLDDCPKRKGRPKTWKRGPRKSDEGGERMRVGVLARAIREARARGTDEELEAHIDGFKR